MPPAFIPGLELSGLLYDEVVAPLLIETYPALIHSAALIGYGSDVLGFDTVRSTDHEWGPRLLLFVRDEVLDDLAPALATLFAERLPRTFRGYSTHFATPWSGDSRVMTSATGGPIDHKIEIHSPRRFFTDRIGVDPLDGLSAADWLTVPQQLLLEMTAGRVYHDGLDELAPRRSALNTFPRDVWLYLMACQWRRIAQIEPFIGRTGEVGDDLGSRLITAALARDAMKLCFLLERRYTPYSKWFGTAFARLDHAPELMPMLEAALSATTWQERESGINRATEALARLHNELGVTTPLDPVVSQFHDRPFRVIHGDRFVEALDGVIADPAVRAIIDRVGWAGAVDQWSDSVDILSTTASFRSLRMFYD